MENNQDNYRINPAIAFAVILQLVFMIFAGVTIYNILGHETEPPKIKINNYSAIPEGKIIDKSSKILDTENVNFDFDNAAKNSIEESIYDIALLNNEGSIENNGATIRNNSAYYVYIEDLSTYFLNFIIDIEDLKQSYRVAWHWTNDPSGQSMPAESIMVFCLKENQMIYGSFNCKDKYDGQGLDIVAYNLLRRKMFSNFTVGLSGAQGEGPLNLSINISTNSESAQDAAVKEVSNYLSALGLSLNDFEYSVRYIEIAN